MRASRRNKQKNLQKSSFVARCGNTRDIRHKSFIAAIRQNFLCLGAYETLSDENKRREYDQFGRHGGQGNNGSPFHQSSFNFNFDDLFKDYDLFSQYSRSKKHFENHFRSHREAHNRQRRSFQEFSFGGGLFDDVFENMEKMFSFSDFENAHRHAVRTDNRFHGSSKHCRTVTQRRGNMVTTYTDCSGQ